MQLAGKADPALLAALGKAIRAAFAHVFFYAAAIAALTLVGSLWLKEIPLRGGLPQPAAGRAPPTKTAGNGAERSGRAAE